MGKAKKRNFSKNKDNIAPVLKRQDVVCEIILAIRKNCVSDEIKRLISLFGITAEELSEAGASFEELSAVKNIVL